MLKPLSLLGILMLLQTALNSRTVMERDEINFAHKVSLRTQSSQSSIQRTYFICCCNMLVCRVVSLKKNDPWMLHLQEPLSRESTLTPTSSGLLKNCPLNVSLKQLHAFLRQFLSALSSKCTGKSDTHVWCLRRMGQWWCQYSFRMF